MKFSEDLLRQIADNSFSDSYLRLDSCNIDDEGAIKLANALNKNTYIGTVDLADNMIGEQGAMALAKVTSIENLNLACNQIKDNGFMAFLESCVITLNVSGNLITDH